MHLTFPLPFRYGSPPPRISRSGLVFFSNDVHPSSSPLLSLFFPLSFWPITYLVLLHFESQECFGCIGRLQFHPHRLLGLCGGPHFSPCLPQMDPLFQPGLLLMNMGLVF